eukprot:3875920-Pleurochrysis_carterae.AAC.1
MSQHDESASGTTGRHEDNTAYAAFALQIHVIRATGLAAAESSHGGPDPYVLVRAADARPSRSAVCRHARACNQVGRALKHEFSAERQPCIVHKSCSMVWQKAERVWLPARTR